ncbi:MAG: hypothetical protein ACXVII_45210 [Solirubrobacteraceae bacterium]
MSSVVESPGAGGNIAIPERVERTGTSHPQIDAAVGEVGAHRIDWQRLSVAGRIELLERLIADTAAVAQRWVQAECERKRIAFDSPTAGEEWGLGPWSTLANMRHLAATLRDVERHGHPRLPRVIDTVNGGDVRARVFPRDAYDRALFMGITGEVSMPPGVSAEEVHATVGGIYRSGDPPQARIGVILGAGNASAIPFMDVLYKMFAENQVVVLKLNPITDHLRPVFDAALRALIEGCSGDFGGECHRGSGMMMPVQQR